MGRSSSRFNCCYSTSDVFADFAVGGLVGYCENENTIRSCYSTGNITGQSYLGGLCGINWDSLINCYASGSVNGVDRFGGLCGENIEGTISGGYFLHPTDGGGPDNGYGTPLLDEHMRQQRSFNGWNFSNIWDICDGTNYPKLAWQEPVPGDFICPDGVDLQDFTIIADEWLMTGADLISDIYPKGGDGIVDLYDLNLFCQNWLTDVFDPLAGPLHIHRGTAIVDGDLSDWSNPVEWIDLVQIYYGNPMDITDAKVAFRWDSVTNKVYAAVVVTDTNHIFTDDYQNYDASDRIEIYSQGSAAGGEGFYGNYGTAQHYMVGPDTAGGSWGTWALGQTIDPDANFEYAVQVVGDQIIYEIGITQFDYYGHFASGNSILTNLYPGRTIGLDIIASTRHTTGFGMLAENLMTDKYLNADQFARYLLVE